MAHWDAKHKDKNTVKLISSTYLCCSNHRRFRKGRDLAAGQAPREDEHLRKDGSRQTDLQFNNV